MSKVELETAWACIQKGCFETGTGPDSDKQAERHTRAFGHPTRCWSVPKGSHGTTADAERERPPGAGAVERPV